MHSRINAFCGPIGAAILLACAGLARAQTPTAPPPTSPAAPTTAAPVPPLTEEQKNALIKRGPDGKLVRYEVPFNWAAIDVDPQLSPEQREKIRLELPRRNLQHEIAEVNNLDMIMLIDQGQIDKLDLRDRHKLPWMERATKLLRVPAVLSEWLRSRQLITGEQAASLQSIVDAYGKALMEESKAAAGEDKSAISVVVARELYHQRLEEPIYVFRRLLVVAADNADPCLEKTKMPDDIRASLAAEVAAIKAATTDAEKRRAVTALLDKMPDWVMQHQFMDAAIDAGHPGARVPGAEHAAVAEMAYKVEQRRRDEAAKNGKSVEYQKSRAPQGSEPAGPGGR